MQGWFKFQILTALGNLGCPGIRIGPLYADLFSLSEMPGYVGLFLAWSGPFPFKLWIYHHTRRLRFERAW